MQLLTHAAAMALVSFLHMNEGDDGTSYARNSFLQKKVILKVRPFLEDSIKDMFNSGIPSCVKLADLGCSSGPNTLSAVSEIVGTIHGLSAKMNCKSPDFQVFLNDLPGNDFNTIFKSFPDFYRKLKEENEGTLGHCFIMGLPGSFYERIFPSRGIDFVHASCSAHWLSQTPIGLENNKGHIYMAKASPPNVFEAYANQFQRDFSLFLELRSEEVTVGGRMVITLLGRSIEDPSSKDCCDYWELLAKSLLDMVTEGLVEEADLDSFNIPFYTPFEGEVRSIVEEEGSFNLDKLQTFESNWDPFNDSDMHKAAETIGNQLRSAMEPLLANHFGNIKIENLFGRFKGYVVKHLLMGDGHPHHIFIVMSLTKKQFPRTTVAMLA